jgi:fructose-1,6-bisphosphatase I
MDDSISLILYRIQKSCIEISKLLHDEDLYKLSSLSDKINKSGDDMKKLDQQANDILKKNLIDLSCIKAIASEEEINIIYTDNYNGEYLISFDPLDGSQNIGTNITTGTIFGIFKWDNTSKITSGRSIVCAGYCVYGAATQFVLAYEKNVSLYQYITKEEKFILQRENIIIPKSGKFYSINEAYHKKWHLIKIRNFVNKIREKKSNRWVGCMVADIHRTLLQGGCFLYPSDTKNKQGKLRLFYEAYPMAFIFENAKGTAITDYKASNNNVNILDVLFPINIHQQIPVVFLGKEELSLYNQS